jgi:superfamily II DNA/RNA helicase
MTSTLESRVTEHASTRAVTPAESDGFAALGLSPRLVDALAKAGITHPFPIQRATVPDALAGRDVLGRGRTGSGKTYAFAIPVLERLVADGGSSAPGRPRALVLAPTRELASQIEATMAPLAKALGLRTMTVYGGVRANPQIAALRKGVDIVIACPGRLADHLQSGHVKLDRVVISVLDEADHMADLGFLPVVRRLLDQTPRNGQRLLFSATLDAAVDVLVKRFMRNPVTHSIDSAQSPVSSMAHHVLHVDHAARVPVLVDLASAPGRTLVFTRTKHGARLLARKLTAAGAPAVELHGNLSQGARAKNLAAFSNGSSPTLVATDIAARGIHVDDIALVVHADPPVEHKAYLHRSGRTARAGNSGTVVTLMTDAQVRDVRTLTRKAGVKPTVTKLGSGHPLLAEIAPGERTLVTPSPLSERDDSRGRSNGGRQRNGRPRNGRGGESRGTYGRGNNSRGGEGRSSTDSSGGRGRPRRSGSTSERRTNESRGNAPSRSGGAAGFSSGGSRRRGR